MPKIKISKMQPHNPADPWPNSFAPSYDVEAEVTVPTTERVHSSNAGTKLGDFGLGAEIDKVLPALTGAERGRKRILADINKFQLNVRNILISPYKNLRSGETGELDFEGNKGAGTGTKAGPSSYLNTDPMTGDEAKGCYLSKGMEHWHTGSDKGRRLREGNFPLQLDISKGWVSVFGTDENTDTAINIDLGKKSDPSTSLNMPAPGTYHHVAVVVNKWHKLGMKMVVGAMDAPGAAGGFKNRNGTETGGGGYNDIQGEAIITTGNLAREICYGDFTNPIELLTGATPTDNWADGQYQGYSAATKEVPEYVRYKSRLAQTFQKVTYKYDVDPTDATKLMGDMYSSAFAGLPPHSAPNDDYHKTLQVDPGFTMANNTFSNRQFNNAQAYREFLTGPSPSTNDNRICVGGTGTGGDVGTKGFKSVSEKDTDYGVPTGGGAAGDKLLYTAKQLFFVGDCVIFLRDQNSGSKGNDYANLKHGGTYYIHSIVNKDGTGDPGMKLSANKGGPVITVGNDKGSSKDRIIKFVSFRKELSDYPSGTKDIGCSFLAREKFRHYLTSDVTSHGGINFAYRHNIPIGTALKYTDNSVATIPELVSGNTYYVVKNTSGLTEGNPNGRGTDYDNSGGLKARHIMISAEKNGTPILIADGGGAAQNKFRELRPTAYNEVKYLTHSSTQVGQHSSDVLENMYFEPLVMVKKLNPPLVITGKTKDINFTWRMTGGGHISMGRAPDLERNPLNGTTTPARKNVPSVESTWERVLEGTEDSAQGPNSRQGESVGLPVGTKFGMDITGGSDAHHAKSIVLNVDELNFSVKAI